MIVMLPIFSDSASYNISNHPSLSNCFFFSMRSEQKDGRGGICFFMDIRLIIEFFFTFAFAFALPKFPHEILSGKPFLWAFFVVVRNVFPQILCYLYLEFLFLFIKKVFSLFGRSSEINLVSISNQNDFLLKPAVVTLNFIAFCYHECLLLLLPSIAIRLLHLTWEILGDQRSEIKFTAAVCSIFLWGDRGRRR